MYDKVHYIAPFKQVNGTTAGQPNPGAVQLVRTRIKIPAKKVQFVAGSTAGMHKIYLLVFSCSINGVGASPYFNYQSRVEYNDG